MLLYFFTLQLLGYRIFRWLFNFTISWLFNFTKFWWYKVTYYIVKWQTLAAPKLQGFSSNRALTFLYRFSNVSLTLD